MHLQLLAMKNHEWQPHDTLPCQRRVKGPCKVNPRPDAELYSNNAISTHSLARNG